VGRPHGLDGSFNLANPTVELELGMSVRVADHDHLIVRLGGTTARPLLRLEGVRTREHAARLGGEVVLVPAAPDALGDGEWLADDLVGCEVEGLGKVKGVVGGPSCDVLELEDGTLVPLVSDAVTAIDLAEGRIAVNRGFLGLGDR